MNISETRAERAMRFSKIWWQSRADAKKSQEYMALGLGVSKKTIQNWEKGISSPDLFQWAEWFNLLGLNPTHYFLAFLYPNIFEIGIDKADDKAVEDVLIQMIKESSPKERRQLLYLMSGEHGSSWHALLQLFTAHCHTSMQSRAAAARLIADNYEIESDNNKLVCPDSAQPDMDALKEAIDLGKIAAKKSENGYAPNK